MRCESLTSSGDRTAPSTARLRNTRAPVGRDAIWYAGATGFLSPSAAAILRWLHGYWDRLAVRPYPSGLAHGVTPIAQSGGRSARLEKRAAHSACVVANRALPEARGRARRSISLLQSSLES